jgi:hypothetical protein
MEVPEKNEDVPVHTALFLLLRRANRFILATSPSNAADTVDRIK